MVPELASLPAFLDTPRGELHLDGRCVSCLRDAGSTVVLRWSTSRAALVSGNDSAAREREPAEATRLVTGIVAAATKPAVVGGRPDAGNVVRPGASAAAPAASMATCLARRVLPGASATRRLANVVSLVVGLAFAAASVALTVAQVVTLLTEGVAKNETRTRQRAGEVRPHAKSAVEPVLGRTTDAAGLSTLAIGSTNDAPRRFADAPGSTPLARHLAIDAARAAVDAPRRTRDPAHVALRASRITAAARALSSRPRRVSTDMPSFTDDLIWP